MLGRSKSTETLELSLLGAAIAVTLLAIYLHVTFMLHAGGLWRDEAVTYNVAAKPSIVQLWQSLPHDSFPGLFHFILRTWIGLGFGSSDSAIRLLGCLVGMSVLGGLWMSGIFFGRTIPLFSVVFLGLSPLVIRTTDAIRAYGIGVLCILLTFCLVWKVVTSPSVRTVVAATSAAVLSVQSLYQNSFLVLAICLSGAVVALRRHRGKRAALILGIGLVAALSVLPYATTLRNLIEVKPLIAHGVPLSRILQIFSLALSEGGNFMLWFWLGATALGFAIAVCAQVRPAVPRTSETSPDSALFSMTALLTAVIGFLVWLKMLGFPTQPWYYVPLMALIAVALDSTFGTLPPTLGWKAPQLLFAVVISGLTLFPAVTGVLIRQTNIDRIALELDRRAAWYDFILVDPWYCGASFGRYYKGATPWTTLPPLEDPTLHRLDLFKNYMIATDPIKSVLDRMAATLRNGQRIWLVVGSPFWNQGKAPEAGPAPGGGWGWDHDAYSRIWAIQTANLLQSRALRLQPVAIPDEKFTNQFEDLELFVTEGWQGK